MYTWIDAAGLDHGGLLSGGSYYLYDIPNGLNAHGDGINDSGIMVGRYNPVANPSTYDGFKAAK